jgi:hypothetical protein
MQQTFTRLMEMVSTDSARWLKLADLGQIWFALEAGVLPPSYIYIELMDRQTNTKYKSNLADTTL